jgi:hypothetical protein
MNRASSMATSSKNPKQAEIANIAEQAILVLDQLAFKIHSIAQGKLPKQYWDWIADDITPYVESSLRHTLRMPKGREVLEQVTPATCLEQWVTHWVMPYVREHYGFDLPKADTNDASVDTTYTAPPYPDVLVY